MAEVDDPGFASEQVPNNVSPRAIRAAFWLWLPLLVVQAIFLVMWGAALVMSVIRLLTTPNSGPGEGFVILVALPVIFVLGTLLGIEIPLLVQLRRGKNWARIWLMVFAIVTALLAALTALSEFPQSC